MLLFFLVFFFFNFPRFVTFLARNGVIILFYVPPLVYLCGSFCNGKILGKKKKQTKSRYVCFLFFIDFYSKKMFLKI